MNDHPSAPATGKRRVLFPFVGDTVGGSHISALELVAGLDSDRFEPIVLVHRKGRLRSYLNGRGIAAEQAPDLGLGLFSKKTSRNILPAMTLAAPLLVGFLRRLRIDIVHTHDVRMHFHWGPAAKLVGASFVLHQRTVSRSRHNFSFRFADSILVASEYTRDHLPPVIAARVQVVRNPFRPPRSTEDRGLCRDRLLAAANKSSHAKTIIGYVANFMHHKRPLVFVEMAARLRDRFGDELFFPMFGETDRDETIRHQVSAKIAEYDLTSRCVFMEPRFPIEPWIMGCNVLVAPAVGEPHGRTLVEAMLCGTPVVAADDGGHKEIIRHRETGLLVPSDDAAAFAGAVAELHENPEMAKSIAVRAKATALTTYSVEAHVERVQSIYDSLPR